MTTTTHTMAGRMAHAGAARPVAGAMGCLPAAYAVPAATAHASTTWTSGVIAGSTTFVVFDDKNRPTQRPPELSP